MNNNIWKYIFSFFKPISDNALIVSLLMTITLSLFTMFIFRKYTKIIPIVGFGYMFSLASAIEKIPLYHKRMHLALSLSSDIIMKSDKYMDAFYQATNVKPDKALNIINALYSERFREALLETEPKDLYTHFYNAYDAVNKSFIGNINNRLIEPNMYIYAFLISLIILCVILFFFKYKQYINAACITLILFSLVFNIGVVINMILFVISLKIFIVISQNI